MATPRSSHGFRLISSAQAEIIPLRRNAGATGGWAIQVGAFSNASQAKSAADTARNSVSAGHSSVGSTHQSRGTLYRARLTGLSHEAAIAACEKHRGSCMVLSPDAQS